MERLVESRQSGVDFLNEPPEGSIEAFLQDGHLSDKQFEQLMTDFSSTAEKILASEKPTSPELREMLDFGLTYHKKGVRQAIAEVNGHAPDIEVDLHQFSATRWSEKLVGLIGAKYVGVNGGRQRVFLGVATRGTTHVLVDIEPMDGDFVELKSNLDEGYSGGPSNVTDETIERLFPPQKL